MEEDDFDDTYTSTVYKPSFVLIAIDADVSMFITKESDKTTPFKSCINACYDLANSIIFAQNKRSWSPFGVVLAHEDASASLVNFDDNVLDSIKSLKEKRGFSEEKLADLYKRKGGLDLSAFFLFCKKKFKEVNSEFYKRTIIYITCDDNPTRDDTAQRFAVLNEAKNFEANSISFELVTMKPDFDYKIFYNELFSVLKVDPVENFVEDEDGLMEKLASSVVVRFYQRRLNFFPFLGDEERFLKVTQKSFIKEEKFYNNAFMSTDGKPLKKISKNAADVIKKFKLKHGMARFEFDLDEYREILDTDLPIGYHLIKVCNSVTEVGNILTDPVILEVNFKEELNFFPSFWQYCVDKEKVLLCARKLRNPDKIRFVEFIPKFVNNARVFIIKAIPFSDEIKHPPSKLASTEDNDEVVYSESKLSVTNELINNLTFHYDTKMFVDPSSAKRKAFLRSKLLDEPKEDVEDVTLDNKGIDESLGVAGTSFLQLFKLYEEEKGTKRKASSTRTAAKRKN